MKIKKISKSEWFAFKRPLAEPEAKWSEKDDYYIERKVFEDGRTVWYGLNVNWKKEPGKSWAVLFENEDAKPLEEYFPEIVYGEDRMMWKDCEMPVYEKLYIEMENEKKNV